MVVLDMAKKTYDNQIDIVGKKIDDYKDSMALDNINCVVFRVNADVSSMSHIKKSLLETFHDIFYMDFINWEECEKFALGSLLIDVCKAFRNKVSIPNIAKQFSISEKTVKRYLDSGKNIGLCNDFRKNKIRKEEMND